MKLNRTVPTIALALAIVLSFIAGFAYASLNSHELPNEFDPLIDVWNLLKQHYVNQSAVNATELSRGAIEGMLEILDDPYTAYYYDYEEFHDYLEGSFEGIGATVSKEDGLLTIVSPIKGSPAEQAGIRAGDIILEIDGEPTDDLSVNDAVLRIRGPKGTTVTLLIQHEDESDPVEMQIVRDTITLPTVYYEALADNIGYIQITQFTTSSVSEFQTALSNAMGNGSEGLVLDLRGNPGGFLDVVFTIADEFLDSGFILYESTDSLEIINEWPASTGGMASDLTLVVLVDEGSASGSEVLAGALQDQERAAIIGTQTYGKGSVDSTYQLQDGSALYLTTSRWLTPDKHLIEGVGITPDFVVEISDEDAANDVDTQLNFAIEYLKSQIQP